ncbi:sigma-70 family RNA polymerase sigma factor [Anabaena sp. UHCC 0399]|uniref:sigma-70 family RNA polymerase sigma factor n=1 Tax=Anabaena sp. UHCC 0399 TaxID=3110238 RepID=UPI002B21A128|nr:sigma-70 family RNA polymerase sigma factor [Anabaena sp. UHCC 0399]MEA5567500.1 sigma-70 family RNA polymerase sigma factor [Anabaena sp. UHCC 0399]
MSAFNRQAFDQEFNTLLNSGSPSANSMLAFIKRSLAQFHLSNSYSITWVLNEAYMRGVKLITAGERIEKPLAWVRRTAYNIIREQSRELKRCLPLEESLIESQSDLHFPSIEEDDNEFFQRIKLAFEKLEPQEREILLLKTIKNLSWKEIKSHLESQGKVIQTESTLRKRKERALKHLRDIFNSLEPQNV